MDGLLILAPEGSKSSLKFGASSVTFIVDFIVCSLKTEGLFGNVCYNIVSSQINLK